MAPCRASRTESIAGDFSCGRSFLVCASARGVVSGCLLPINGSWTGTPGAEGRAGRLRRGSSCGSGADSPGWVATAGAAGSCGAGWLGSGSALPLLPATAFFSFGSAVGSGCRGEFPAAGSRGGRAGLVARTGGFSAGVPAWTWRRFSCKRSTRRLSNVSRPPRSVIACSAFWRPSTRLWRNRWVISLLRSLLRSTWMDSMRSLTRAGLRRSFQPASRFGAVTVRRSPWRRGRSVNGSRLGRGLVFTSRR